MSRQALFQPFINVSIPSINPGTGAASTVPDYKAGTVFQADNGLYVYGQSNGATVEGYLAKFVEGTWDFDTVTTAESGSTQTPLGVCVASGGLIDNQWGWWWRGGAGGSEYVYLTTTISADTQVTTHTVAGQGSTGGDPIHNLFANASSGSGGLTLCRSGALLETNTTITN